MCLYQKNKKHKKVQIIIFNINGGLLTNKRSKPVEAQKPQTPTKNEFEVSKKDEALNIKPRKKRIKKSTGLTKNYDHNDPNINLEKLFDND